MTFPQYEDSTGSHEASFTGTHTIDLPATKVADDIWVLIWALSGSGGTVTGPSGWTEIVTFDLNSNQKFRVWIYRATGSESSTTTITTSEWNRSAALVRRYSGASTEDINDIWAASTAVYAFTSNPDPSSVTNTWGVEDNLFIAAACHTGRGNPFSAYPASYSNGVAEEEPNDVGVAAADRQLASDTDDPGTFTIADDENTAAVTIQLKPVTALQATINDSGNASDNDQAEIQGQPRPSDFGTATDSISVDLRLVEPANNFPLIPLETRLEMQLGDTLLDVSDRLISQQLDPSSGRADESSETEPGSLSVTLDNADGHLTPHNPNSPYYPHVDVGADLKLSVRAGDVALVVPGDASYASTPDHPDFDVTDLDVRLRIDPTAWTRDSFQRLASRYDFPAAQRCWAVGILATGAPYLVWSTDGSSGNSVNPASFYDQSALRPIWLGWTLDVNNGAGGYDLTFWRYDADTPPSDITSWEVIEIITGGSPTSIFPGTASIEVGAMLSTPSSNFDGRILAFQHRDSINGSLVAEVDFTSVEFGTKAFVGDRGKTWTLAGSAQISNWRNRFTMTVDDIVPEWPHGDNQPHVRPLDLSDKTITLDWDDSDIRTSEHRVHVTASGILRRLGQGESPIRSALYRHISTGGGFPEDITAYWPMEERKGAGRLTAAGDHADMDFNGPLNLGQVETLLASAPLPIVEDGESVTLEGVVPDGPTDWAVSWFAYIETPTTDPTVTRLMTVRTNGTIASWQAWISDTTFYVRAYDSSGGTVVSNDAAIGSDLFDRWLNYRIEVVQNGSDVDFTITAVKVDTGTVSTLNSDTITSETSGRVTYVGGEITSAPDGYVLGHIVVTNTLASVGWLAGADTAWVGEAASARFFRLCQEEGIEAETVGDSNHFSLRGDSTVSQLMGPQEQKTLLELLNECAALDGGIIIERRGRPGLIYRLRSTLENQTPAMVLDASANGIIRPLEPRADDQLAFNDVTVTAAFGTSGRVVDVDSVEARRTYSTARTLAGVGGVDIQDAIVGATPGLRESIVRQNLDIASWVVHLGTWPGMRFPTVTIPLDVADELIEPWLKLAIGDRIQIINLPAQLPDEIVDLIVNHVTDSMAPVAWRPQVICRPGGPWQIGELE